jgi:FAD/FMN-containing dehydrogenase
MTLNEASIQHGAARAAFCMAADRVDRYMNDHPNDKQAAAKAMAEYDKAAAQLAAVVTAIEAAGHHKRDYAPEVWEREQFTEAGA